MRSKRLFTATVAAFFMAAAAFAPSASASHRLVEQWTIGGTGFGGVAADGDDDFFYEHHAQHGPSDGHLPGSQKNVNLLGKLKLTNFVGDISDVSATQAPSGKWFAYVGDWGAKCQTGGVHVVDISNPANPVKTGFLNAGGTGYQTEGVQALHISTSAYTGDILVVSNEWCLPKSNPSLNPGGITIYDINDPTNPKRLVQAFGDFDATGTGRTSPTAQSPGTPGPRPTWRPSTTRSSKTSTCSRSRIRAARGSSRRRACQA